MRRRRHQLTPTLFPFLAVLVCTLGTLILLLALVAQNATVAAEREAEAETQQATAADRSTADTPVKPAAEEVEQKIEEQSFRVAELVSHREEQSQSLERRRDELTHLEDHLRRIRGELERLEGEVKAATENPAEETGGTRDLVLLKRQLEKERATVEQLQGEKDSATPRIVIVPHDGPNGTDRRPVYLECTPNGVTIRPEGTEISMPQLKASSPGANPLDEALRVIRHHALQYYGDEIPPYPLLVVRPGGIEAYAEARKAMRDWDDQFGYELVPAATRLAYGQGDPSLKKRIEQAVRRAVSRQDPPRSIAARPTGPSRRRHFPTLSARELDRDARTQGFRASRDPFGEANRHNARGRSGRTSAGDDIRERLSRSRSAATLNPGGAPANGLGDGSNPAAQLDQRLRSMANRLAQGSGSPQGAAGAAGVADASGAAGGSRQENVGDHRVAGDQRVTANPHAGVHGDRQAETDASPHPGTEDGSESGRQGGQQPGRQGGQQPGTESSQQLAGGGRRSAVSDSPRGGAEATLHGTRRDGDAAASGGRTPAGTAAGARPSANAASATGGSMIGTGQAAASRADNNAGRNAGPPPSSRGGTNQPAADPVRRVGRNWRSPSH